MIGLFSVTLLVSASLLFAVQPMVGRLVLPLLGGTPAVWNTCMVFFQAILLAGYAYAHLAPARLGLRRQILVHTALLLMPLLVLPLALPDGGGEPGRTNPVPWLLGVLTLSIGLPFFVLSTTAPLLQRWLAASPEPAARDPYHLYVASNLGSLLALVAYPFLLEPLVPLGRQCEGWSVGYGVFVLLTLVCAACTWRTATTDSDTRLDNAGEAEPPSVRTRGRWLLLSAVPSGLLIATTTHITTDVAAVPLLWVAPLALYLLTFILAFARRRIVSVRALSRWAPLVVLVLALVLLTEATEPLIVVAGLHLLGLFWLALFCHTALADDRPPVRYLTAFYLLLSAGGVLGGLFTALLAPLLFSGVVEYPLLLVLACLLRPAEMEGSRWRDVAWAVGLGLATAGLVVAAGGWELPPGQAGVAAVFGPPVLVCYTFHQRPIRFGLGIAALLLAGGLYQGVYGRTETRVRSFFGVHRITIDPSGRFRLLIHGNTVHGQQSLDPTRQREPLTYYGRTGPAGQVMRALAGDERLRRVGIVGLGTGAMFCYANPGDRWTCFEIDPAVLYLARDSGLFTYLSACPAEIEYVEGDARRTLARPGDRFGVLVIDAFSSDAIPVHLLTRDALAVYRRRLTEDGLLLFNVSNRFLDLAPVLAALARDADPSLVAYHNQDLALGEDEKREGKAASEWVLLAPSREAALKVIRSSSSWFPVETSPSAPVWTDDHVDIFGAMKWE